MHFIISTHLFFIRYFTQGSTRLRLHFTRSKHPVSLSPVTEAAVSTDGGRGVATIADIGHVRSPTLASVAYVGDQPSFSPVIAAQCAISGLPPLSQGDGGSRDGYNMSDAVGAETEWMPSLATAIADR
ncbi:hypothetical protein Y032_0057g2784 [Ancylostoma ceylanicum]|uniref:Uncharacterized protein n=1 Tax=Ancylostoma ceylanicum TaxID=53326 RepID=A0A016U5D0_9BILA|nr:hypothetical protein Y032_0057g2784 [Ancylostoma ceylanicum]